VLRSFVMNLNLSYIYFLFRRPPNAPAAFSTPKKPLSLLKVLFPVDSSCVGGRDPKRGTRTSGGLAVPSRSSPFHSSKESNLLCVLEFWSGERACGRRCCSRRFKISELSVVDGGMLNGRCADGLSMKSYHIQSSILYIFWKGKAMALI
jgi:hypothetical protein